jgi:PAS domain S-box-containing protein
LDSSITDFYCNPSEWKRLIRETEEVETQGRHHERALITLQVNGREVCAQHLCCSLRDPETNAVVGYIGCLEDVTEQERYHRLFERAPCGVYRVNEKDMFVHVNDLVLKMLGYQSETEIEGRRVNEFYADQNGYYALKEELKRHSSVSKVIPMVKKSGEIFFVAVAASKTITLDGSYEGFEGTMVDVTAEEQDRRMLSDVPVGVYIIHVENGQDIIRRCNQQFAQMFEFDSVDEAIGANVLDLYADPNDYALFMAQLKSKHELGYPLVGYIETLKTRKGREFSAEVNSRLLRDSKDNIFGRIGVVRDVTKEVAIRGRLKELVADIGRVFHPVSATLLMIQHSLDPVRKALGPDPFDGQRAPTAEEADAILEESVAPLIKSLDKLLKLADSERRAKALSAEKWSELYSLLQLLKEYKTTVNNIEFRPPTLRDAARKVIDICGNIQKRTLPQEPARQVQRNAENLERLACLIDLHRARTAILDMDHQVRALRDYATWGVRPPEPKGVYRLSDLLKQAIGNLTEFSRNQGVDIELKDSCPHAQVKVVERDVVRALTNLLHNAIKYSWSRVIGRPPWIAIRSSIVRDQVRVEFENWGVPIPRDEIEKELIFKIGYRGRWSSDRGRLGTGIGLYEARRVAREHGGDVTIESRPADSYGAPDDYSQPFLTTATLTLPLHRG